MSRTKKKDYNAETILMSAVRQAVSLYEDGLSLARIAEEMKTDGNRMNPLKVRKLLITGMVHGLCEYESEKAGAVLELYNRNYSIAEMMEELHLSRASVYSYVPYRRVLYANAWSADASVTADRIHRYRERKNAVENLRMAVGTTEQTTEQADVRMPEQVKAEAWKRSDTKGKRAEENTSGGNAEDENILKEYTWMGNIIAEDGIKEEMANTNGAEKGIREEASNTDAAEEKIRKEVSNIDVVGNVKGKLNTNVVEGRSGEEANKNTAIEKLWLTVIAFQNYPFRTISGLPFTYQVKTGRNGSYTKELLIDRRENSKTLSWSSVVLAFHAAQDRQGQIIVRPKALGDIRGISYLYPMLWRFGIIEVPEKAAKKMGCQQKKELPEE